MNLAPTLAALGLALSLLLANASAFDPASVPSDTQTNTICPITGKPVDPSITMIYEGRTYSFASEACRTKFKEARDNSLYQKLGVDLGDLRPATTDKSESLAGALVLAAVVMITRPTANRVAICRK